MSRQVFVVGAGFNHLPSEEVRVRKERGVVIEDGALFHWDWIMLTLRECRDSIEVFSYADEDNPFSVLRDLIVHGVKYSVFCDVVA